MTLEFIANTFSFPNVCTAIPFKVFWKLLRIRRWEVLWYCFSFSVCKLIARRWIHEESFGESLGDVEEITVINTGLPLYRMMFEACRCPKNFSRFGSYGLTLLQLWRVNQMHEWTLGGDREGTRTYSWSAVMVSSCTLKDSNIFYVCSCVFFLFFFVIYLWFPLD